MVALFDDPIHLEPLLPRDVVADGVLGKAHDLRTEAARLAGACQGGVSRELAALLRETDVWIAVPHERAARVREVHSLVLHCLCDGVDAQLLGESEVP